ELCVTHPKAINQVYLASDGEDVSTPDLVRRMAAALNRPARIFACPPQLLKIVTGVLGLGDRYARLSQSLQVDNSKACNELGWSPRVNLDEGLRQVKKTFYNFS